MISFSFPKDALNSWNKLCYSNEYIKDCNDDRVYFFASKTRQMSFLGGRKLCKSLAPCQELGNLVSIDNCEELGKVYILYLEY